MGNLPVIQRTYDLIKWYVPILSRLPKTHRFGLGERLVAGLLFILMVETGILISISFTLSRGWRAAINLFLKQMGRAGAFADKDTGFPNKSGRKCTRPYS